MPLELESPQSFSISEDPASVGARWKVWKRSFNYFINGQISNISDEKKANILMHVAGREVQDVLATMAQPAMTLQAHLDALDTYFLPKLNKRFERFKFDQAVQEQGESIDAFVTRLKTLSATCEFTDVADRIVDKVIGKCISTQLRKKLLQQTELDLEKLLTLARSIEAVNVQTKVMESNSNSKDAKSVKLTQSKSTGYKQSVNQYTSVDRKAAYQKQASESKCSRCGYNAHKSNERCPAIGKKCAYCSRIGHFSIVCRIKSHNEAKNQNVKKTDKNVNLTQGDTNDVEESNDESIDPHNDESVDPHNQSDEELHFFRINSAGTNVKNRIMIDVELNGKITTMQVDTAADVSLISELDIKNITYIKIAPYEEVLKD